MKAKILILTTIMAVTANIAHAKDNNPKTVWLFGVATSFKDSVIYVTQIQTMNTAKIYGKSGILANRVEYTEQMKYHLNNKGLTDRTTVVFFNRDRKKLEKRKLQLKNRYTRKLKFEWKEMDSNDFQFQTVNEQKLP